MEYILGNGNTAYILALLLGHDTLYIDKENDTICQNKMLANVITIPLNELNARELDILRSKVDFSSAIVHKKIGFKYNNKIYDYATTEMIHNYIKKQHRENSINIDKFQFKTEYDTIDVVKLLSLFKHTITIKYIQDIHLTNNDVLFITNKQANRNSTYTTEYVKYADNDMFDYSYIYDCDYYSNVKRYDATTTEYITNVDDAVAINNYNAEPIIQMDYDVTNNIKKYYIGRYASKTRLLLSHVIKFAINYKETK